MASLINDHPPAQPSTNNPTPTPSKNPSLLLGIVLTSSVLSVTLLLIWLMSKWALSINELYSYTVTSATVDPFNISSSQLTAAWNISIHIKSIKYDLDFDRAHSSIYYGSHLLSQVSIPSFDVTGWHDKTLHARLMNHSESLDVDVADSMVRDRLLRGAVDFRVELIGRGRLIGIFGYKFNISCENVTVGFPVTHDVGPGVMLGPPRKCIVLVDGKTNNKG